MDDRYLSGEEKRARMKEQFKKELAEEKRLRELLKQKQQEQKLNATVNRIENLLTDDDTDEWVQKLNQKSAQAEARYEMSIDSNATYQTPDLANAAIGTLNDSGVSPLTSEENNEKAIDITPPPPQKNLGDPAF